MNSIVIRPDLHTQFGARMPRFCLVTDEGNPFDISLAPSSLYSECSSMTLDEDESLTQLLKRAPHDADLLVVCPNTFTVSPTPEQIGLDRRLSVLPCASTPITGQQLEYFLDVCEHTDPQALQERCDRIVRALESSEVVRISDAEHGAQAVFEIWHDYEWNQQAGLLEGGAQQIAPSGELSALPVSIDHFDKSARLALSGQIALHGSAIVHRGEGELMTADANLLYEKLAVLSREALILDIDAGLITGLHPAGLAAKPAADALELLLSEDGNYRVVWEFGLGLNTAIRPVEGNCGMNEMYGGTDGVLHLGLGLTPTTRFALTFHCKGTTVSAGDEVLAAPARRTLNRRRSAACGCAEGAQG